MKGRLPQIGNAGSIVLSGRILLSPTTRLWLLRTSSLRGLLGTRHRPWKEGSGRRWIEFVEPDGESTQALVLPYDLDNSYAMTHALALRGTAFALYTVPGHQTGFPARNRYRVVLPLTEPIPLDLERQALQAANERLGGLADLNAIPEHRRWSAPIATQPRSPMALRYMAGRVLSPDLLLAPSQKSA